MKKDIENSISHDAAQWGLYGDYANMVPMFISSLLMGMKSDQIGRRFIFVFPFIPNIIYYIVLAVVIKCDLHYGWLLIGIFINGCGGGRVSMFFSTFAVVSDTHGPEESSSSAPPTATVTANGTTENSAHSDTATAKRLEAQKAPDNNQTNMSRDCSRSFKLICVYTATTKKLEAQKTPDDDQLDMTREYSRTFKLIALDVLRNVAFSLISFGTGYIIKYAGFFYSAIICVCFKVSLMIFAYCFVTETGKQKKNEGFMTSLRVIGKALKDPAKRTTLILVNLALYLYIFGLCDEFEIIRTYQMSPPFCLGSVQLGWLSGEAPLVTMLSVPVMWVLKRLHISEVAIAGLGNLAVMTESLMLSTLRYTWVFFVGPIISTPGILTRGMANVITSRLIGRSALASTFSLMFAGGELFWFAGSISASYVYQTYLPILPTAPFYLATASFAASALIFGTLAQKECRSPTAGQVTEMTIN